MVADPSASTSHHSHFSNSSHQSHQHHHHHHENAPAHSYREKARFAGYIDLGLCIGQGIVILAVIAIAIMAPSSESGSEGLSRVPDKDRRAVLFALILILSWYLAHYVLKIIAALTLLQATEEGVPPQVAQGKLSFWKVIKTVTLFFALLSLFGASDALDVILDLVNVAVCVGSLVVVHFYAQELDISHH